jgi:hypothetical protein
MEYSLAQSFTHTQTRSNIKHHSCSITGLHSVRDSPDPSTLINLGTTTKDLGYFINCCALLDFTSSSSPDGYSPDPSTLIHLDTTAIGLGCILIYCFFLDLQKLLCAVGGIIFVLLHLHFEWDRQNCFFDLNKIFFDDGIVTFVLVQLILINNANNVRYMYVHCKIMNMK